VFHQDCLDEHDDENVPSSVRFVTTQDVSDLVRSWVSAHIWICLTAGAQTAHSNKQSTPIS